MAKNNKLINDLLKIHNRTLAQYVEEASEIVTPKVYASIAIALHRNYGWDDQAINDLFVESQYLWGDYGWDMIEICEKETGLLLVSEKQARERGEV